jgi:hypothetical protein
MSVVVEIMVQGANLWAFILNCNLGIVVSIFLELEAFQCGIDLDQKPPIDL